MTALMRAFIASILTAFAALLSLLIGQAAFADGPACSAGDQVCKFRQLGPESLPTANIFRTASGAPGPAYWQQEADYVIDVRLDEKNKRLIGELEITYTNNSPDDLNYVWVQLDQNRFRNDSVARMSETASTANGGDTVSFGALARHQALTEIEHGAEIKAVTDARGRDLPYTINGTMMRIDLPRTLESGQAITFGIDWEHNIINEAIVGGRGGYEHFPDSDTYIWFLAQWFPRMAAYTDYGGWLNKQFLGRGEFTLEFGDYEVNITVPDDHVVSATGVLQNPRDVLSSEQRRRLSQAEKSDTPIFIITPEEAKENEDSRSDRMVTWRFEAENVRDFAWSSSRKYIWDAMNFEQESDQYPNVAIYSFYPNEAEPIWSQYSSHAVAHTMEIYNRFSFPYPYPNAQSVNTWERGGMEYPMITFNGYRPTEDEKTGEVTYSRNIKYGLIGVIIHEIGHIYFPMVVNSDEREWTWMDEGLNSFLEWVAEYEWEEEFPILGGQSNPLDVIPTYMTSSGQVPIMTQSDSVLQFGPNAYSKPASSLIVLRETVLGRELFDHAFREYANRWKFKRPTPSDFFRTMEDASGTDLDWFWRGWYFTTDHVDVSISSVREYQISTKDPETEFPLDRERYSAEHPEPISQIRNREEGREMRLSKYPELNDFYNENDRFTVSNKDRNSFKSFIDGLEPWEKEAYEKALEDGQFIYFIDFENVGGLLTPIPLRMTYEDGSTDEMMIPAEIWRRNSVSVTKLHFSDKKIVSFDVDPHHQTADADFSNNSFPPNIRESRLELYKRNRSGRNLMADMLVELKGEEKDEPGDGEAKEVPMEPQQ